MAIYIPQDYKNLLGSVEKTEKAIKFIKDMFQKELSAELSLLRVTAPMVVMSGTGLNDDLNGVEAPVSFCVKDMDGRRAEVVQSLAKWKRVKLAQMNMEVGKGIYTDMNALRPDEELDNIHSIYVDQWDWEKVILKEHRTLAYLKETVRAIYRALKTTERYLAAEYPQLSPCLPDDIYFIHADELRSLYPDMTPKEREDVVTQRYGSVFIIGIGGQMSDGTVHDGRSSDYDDWSSENEDGYIGLNGDLLLWNQVLSRSFEISSMGVRVDEKSLRRQLEIRGEGWKSSQMYHRMLLEGELPLTIGGGIGQSRLCMYLLRKAHIGEIQAAIWPEEMREKCRKAGITLA